MRAKSAKRARSISLLKFHQCTVAVLVFQSMAGHNNGLFRACTDCLVYGVFWVFHSGCFPPMARNLVQRLFPHASLHHIAWVLKRACVYRRSPTAIATSLRMAMGSALAPVGKCSASASNGENYPKNPLTLNATMPRCDRRAVAPFQFPRLLVSCPSGHLAFCPIPARREQGLSSLESRQADKITVLKLVCTSMKRDLVPCLRSRPHTLCSFPSLDVVASRVWSFSGNSSLCKSAVRAAASPAGPARESSLSSPSFHPSPRRRHSIQQVRAECQIRVRSEVWGVDSAE